MPPKDSETSPSLDQFLADAQATARDQLAAAWQLHVERIEEQLHAGWQEQVERVFDERFAELSARLGDEFQRRIDERILAERPSMELRGGQELADRLNQAGRRIRLAESQDAWNASVLDAAAPFCARVALFSLAAQWLRIEGTRGFNAAESLTGREFPVTQAPAFSHAIESLDTVVAVPTAGELSEALLATLGPGAATKVYLFPIANRQKVAAVLYAEPEVCPDSTAGPEVSREKAVNFGALELVASLAGSAIELRTGTAAAARSSNLVALGHQIREAQQIREREQPPSSWSGLSREERDLHLKAQRFARVQVAGMRLYNSQKVKSGRAGTNLYGALKAEIDSGREDFRRQFMEKSAAMVDYLHLELVRTLANDDVALLGPEYPGPLV